MTAIVRIRYRNYANYNVYRSCLPIYFIVIARLLSFLFLNGFERSANIYVTIKSGFTVAAV